MGELGELRVLRDVEDLRDAALAEVLTSAAAAIARDGTFHLALAGGSTPRALYAALAGSEAEFARWVLYFGDERCVPPDDARSNYAMARGAWLGVSPHAPTRVHRMRGEDPPERAALAYERGLRAALGEPPRLDLVLLGLGTDGHTASLFPGSPALAERERLVVTAEAPVTPVRRLTLTLPALHAARALLFLVQGSDKAPALRAVLAAEEDSPPLPARQVARGAARVTWLVDRDAAGDLAGS